MTQSQRREHFLYGRFHPHGNDCRSTNGPFRRADVRCVLGRRRRNLDPTFLAQHDRRPMTRRATVSDTLNGDAVSDWKNLEPITPLSVGTLVPARHARVEFGIVAYEHKHVQDRQSKPPKGHSRRPRPCSPNRQCVGSPPEPWPRVARAGTRMTRDMPHPETEATLRSPDRRGSGNSRGRARAE